eukprot:scaffold33734_cov135-Isochrysis_galbana.AAC.1
MANGRGSSAFSGTVKVTVERGPLVLRPTTRMVTTALLPIGSGIGPVACSTPCITSPVSVTPVGCAISSAAASVAHAGRSSRPESTAMRRDRWPFLG